MNRFETLEYVFTRRRNVGPKLIQDLMRDKKMATSVYLDIKYGNLLGLRCCQLFIHELLGKTPYQQTIMDHVKKGNLSAIKLGRSPFIRKTSIINAIQSGIFN